MDRRDFIKSTATITAAGIVSPSALALHTSLQDTEAQQHQLIVSAPALQNYAETSIGVAFAVSDMANGYVTVSENEDLSNARTIKCGGFRVTDINESIIQIRITGLRPGTRYYYTIGADRISYKGGYNMKIIGSEKDPKVYSFKTAGENADGHFCVLNDTHAKWESFGKSISMAQSLSPSCILMNGDMTNCEETIASHQTIFFNPPVENATYGSEIPLLFCPGNHENRGMAGRHLEKAWMFRQPEERSSRDWDLGRNFAVRNGQIAMIGLDTAEDKVDENPAFAGLFNSEAYREAQALWLKDALKRKEIATAPYLVAFCHIPLFDSNPKSNPGDIHPNDTDSQYSHNFAIWQRTCAKLWTPLLQKAGCQLVISGHTHQYRYDEPTKDRKWAQLVGGGHNLNSENSFPTVIEGKIEDKHLKVTVYHSGTGKVVAEHVFSPK